MIIYQSKSVDPYFNIATEEYFLKKFNDDIFFLYTNEPSIIVGKHQNTIAEINVPYVIENNLKVVRRLSGGGTVFHDLGNVNYCFIKNGQQGFLVDFKRYTKPVIDALQNLGVNAYLRGKSDLVINDLKFSGNAEHVFKDRILHHGTLLFSSQLSELNNSIKADWSKFKDKAVRSNRSKVTNIFSHLKKPLTITEFKEKVIETVLKENNELQPYELTDVDSLEIKKLVKEKYSTWKWNFGYSPTYEFAKKQPFKGGLSEVNMSITKGIIESCKFLINGKPFANSSELELNVTNLPHDYLTLKEKMLPFFQSNTNIPFTFEAFLMLLF